MQKLSFLKQGADRARSGGRWAAFLGLIVVGILAASHTLIIFAQPAPTGVKPELSTEQKQTPSVVQTQEEWRKAMSLKAPPKKGCFTAAYPKTAWLEEKCAVVSGGRHYPAQGTASGNTNTMIAIGAPGLSEAVGSFDSVIGATSVTDSLAGPDRFSLQLNTNFVGIPNGCGDCGWLQFAFASFGCFDPANGNQRTDCLYIEYWLRDWQSSCPLGWTPVADGVRNHCVAFAGGELVTQHQPITSLGDMSIAGFFEVTDNNDTAKNHIVATFAGANGVMVAVSGDDLLALTVPSLGTVGWQEAEFNVFGNDKGSQAQFSSPTTVVVRTQVNYTFDPWPLCIQLGFTRESNNLQVINAPVITKAPLASIAFQETTSGSSLPPECAVSAGDTHLLTFDGLFYDFQASGEFLLAQAAPDFIVQTRQVSGAPTWPNAAINKAVGVKMGKTSVAICLDPQRLEIDGKQAHLGKGKSLSLPGGVRLLRRGDTYFIGRSSGDVVRAEVNGNVNIDVYVGRAAGAPVRGLLGNANGATSDDIAMQAGGVLDQPVSFADLYGRYADSWRVPPNQSLLCPGKKVNRGKPKAPLYANNLTQEQYNYAQRVCTAAGVKDPTLLEACILDVTVIGSDKAANPFVGLTPPVAVMRIGSGVSAPADGVQPSAGRTRLQPITK